MLLLYECYYDCCVLLYVYSLSVCVQRTVALLILHTLLPCYSVILMCFASSCLLGFVLSITKALNNKQ